MSSAPRRISPLLPALVLVAGNPSASTMDLMPAAANGCLNQTLQLELRASVGSRAIGSYHVRVSYDPAKLQIQDDGMTATIDGIVGGDAAEFADGPFSTSAASALATGRVEWNDLNDSSLTAPTGDVSLAKVNFDVLGQLGEMIPVTLQIVTLSDTQTLPILATANDSTVDVAGQDFDADGFCSFADNCPDFPNPSQQDTDLDGLGDACDGAVIVTVSSDALDNPDFGLLADALAASTSTGLDYIVSLLPGTGPYAENVVVPRDLAIRGVGGPVVLDAGAGIGIDFGGSAPQVRLDNLTVMGGTTAVRVDGSLIATDLTIDSAGVGIDVVSGSASLKDSTILSCGTTAVQSAGDLALADSDIVACPTGVGVTAGTTTLSRVTIDGSMVAAVDSTGTLVADDVVVIDGVDGLVLGGGAATLTHLTVADNTGDGIRATGATVTLDNSIAWANGTDLSGVDPGSVSNSDVGTPDLSGSNGNLSVDPSFVDPAGDDYRLTAGSSLLDAIADPVSSAGSPCLDRDRGPRQRDHDGDGSAERDMGAYERANATLAPGAVQNVRFSSPTTLDWDAEGSSASYRIYSTDLATFGYANFGTCLDTTTMTTYEVTAVPTPGNGTTLVVTGVAVSTEEGTLGLATCTERSNFTPCP